jgi:ferritin-like protein
VSSLIFSFLFRSQFYLYEEHALILEDSSVQAISQRLKQFDPHKPNTTVLGDILSGCPPAPQAKTPANDFDLGT